MTTPILPGYLCPECIVRFPYAEKLEEHWKIFHNLSVNDKPRSYPSLRYAAKHNGKNASSNKSSQMLHNFKTRPVNKYAPQVCHLCRKMVWNCTKVCSGCNFTCHVECQPMVLKHCLTLEMNTAKNQTQVCKPHILLNSSSEASSSKEIACNDCELDLTYITDQLIALTFPSNSFEKLYKSGLIDVLALLRKKHCEQYKIINVSERRYDLLQLHSEKQVLDCGWPDHLAPPLDKLTKIIQHIHGWMQLNKKNVAIIHCKGGKSRIGLIVAAYIQFSKNVPSAQIAFEWFALGRFYDAKLDGTLQPSQKRYVKYFGMLFEKKLKIKNRILHLNAIIIHGTPCFNEGLTFQFCLKIYQGYQLIHTTSTHNISSDSKHVCFLTQNTKVQGDVMIKCIQKDASINTLIFRVQFHTDAVDNCVSLFGKYDLDEAFCNAKFPDSCCVELVFSPSEKDEGDHNKERSSRFCVQRQINKPSNDQNSLKLNNYSLSVRSGMDNEETSLGIINELDLLLQELASSKAKSDKNVKENQCDDPCEGFYEIKTAPIYNKVKCSFKSSSKLHLPSKFQISISKNGDASTLESSGSAFNKIYRNTNNNQLENSSLNWNSNNNEPKIPSLNKNSFQEIEDKKCENEICESYLSFGNSLGEKEKNEIVPGTVATRVNVLRNVFYADKEYIKKVDATVSGIESEREVVGKVAQCNSQTLTVNSCNTKFNVGSCNANCNLGSADSAAKISYNQTLNYLSEDSNSLVSNTYNGNTYYNPSSNKENDKRDSDNFDICDNYGAILDDALRSDIESFKSESFPCTDSAYGESMRSSSSSPVLSPLSNEEDAVLNQPFTHGRESPIELQDDSFWIQTDSTIKHFTEKNMEMFVCDTRNYAIDTRNYAIDDQSLAEGNLKNIDRSKKESGTLTGSKNQNSNHASLTIVEERIQPSYVSQEVASFNDEIFQHLIEFEKKMYETEPPKTLQRIPKSNAISKPLNIKNETMVNEYNQRNAMENNALDSSKISYFPNATINRTIENDRIKVTDLNENQPHYNTEQRGFVNTLEYNSDLYPKSPELYNAKQPDLNGTKQMLVNGTIKKNKLQFDSKSIFERTKESSFDQSNSGDSSFESESGSSPKSSSSAVDSPKLPRFPRSISNLSGQQYLSGIKERKTDLPFHHSISADSAIGSECSFSPKSPDSPKFNTIRNRKYRGSGSSNSSTSSAELFLEVARNTSVKFEKDTKNLWYKPHISRDEAAELLRDKQPGSFIVRDSKSYLGAFGLAVKVDVLPINIIKQTGGDLSKLDMNNELVRHFLIEPCKKGVRLKGSTNEPAFPSLVALIYQHTLTKMALPITLVINEESDSVDGYNTHTSTITESQLLIKGAACNLVYLGIVNVESLTGDGAVQYSMNKIIAAGVNLKSTIVNIKVNQQGITLTDNNRKLFFRRHYPMEHVLHCGVDPKDRLFSLKAIVPNCDKEVRTFGIVVRKPAKPQENECLMCAELDPDQPASAVINFIHKTMRYSQGIA